MTEQTQDAQDGGLTLNDITLAVQVIDIASARGAIRGEEMAAVGILRQRFTAFLKANETVAYPKEEEASAE